VPKLDPTLVKALADGDVERANHEILEPDKRKGFFGLIGISLFHYETSKTQPAHPSQFRSGKPACPVSDANPGVASIDEALGDPLWTACD
jgi:hypothetical protein